MIKVLFHGSHDGYEASADLESDRDGKISVLFRNILKFDVYNKHLRYKKVV